MPVDAFLSAGLTNAVWAAALALLAAIAARACRHRPAVAHALWVLVLVRLVTPSVWHVATTATAGAPSVAGGATGQPRLNAPGPATGFQDSLAGPRAANLTTKIAAPAVRPSSPRYKVGASDAPGPRTTSMAATPWPWREALVAIWLMGAVAWWLGIWVSASRFGRLLRAAHPAGDELVERVDRLAARMSLRRAPAVWLVPARVPPMLWALAGSPRLLLPEALWDRLDRSQQDAVLVHELAHLKRGDHWVRRLEAVVLGLYWWDPVAWWARREVERAEEPCCDAWVVWTLPEAGPAYAEALVTTAAFLSGLRGPWPAGASGAGRTPLLRRRLSMILSQTAAAPVSRTTSRAVLVLGVLSLPWLPALAFVQQTNKPAETSSTPGKPQTAAASTGTPPAQTQAVDKPTSRGKQEAGAEIKKTIASLPEASRRKVRVAHPIEREVRDYADFNGLTEAVRTVELRARVSGTLIKVAFEPGKTVDEGDLLFEIDPRSYRAELDRAVAEVQRASARLKRWTATLDRVRETVTNKIAPQSELEKAEGEHAEAEAGLSVAMAARDLARLNIEFTRVTAPFSGNIGSPQLSVGSVAVADTTPLATINSLNPMAVIFKVPQNTLLQFKRAKLEGKTTQDLAPGIPVRVELGNGSIVRVGKVDSVDIRVNPADGTVRCRAVIPNQDKLLLPGMFAKVRMETSAPYKALLIPWQSVRSPNNASGDTAFVITPLNVVEQRQIEIYGYPDEPLGRVKSGLTVDDWVVVEDPKNIKAGETIITERVTMPDQGVPSDNGDDANRPALPPR